MSKKIRLLFITTLLAAIVIFGGCTSSYINTNAPDLEVPTSPVTVETLADVEVLAEVHDEYNNAADSEEPRVSGLLAPLRFADVDELLGEIGMAKFSEFAVSEVELFDIPSGVALHGFETLQSVDALYKPASLRVGFEQFGISVHGASALTFHNTNADGDIANFIWSRSIAVEYAITDFFGRGAISEFLVERNGITYAVTEWVTHDTREPDGWVVAWAQNGQAFMASLPASYTEEDVLAFCDALAIHSWELDGDAVSVSIQGMENVRIFEQSADFEARGVAVPMGAGNELIVVGDVLYRGGQGRAMERVGYRWLIDAELGRYQYVLMPGMYTFQADGVVGTPGLTIRHFEGGDAVSVADYSNVLIVENAGGFYLTVTPDAGDTDLRTSPSERCIFEVSSHAELQYAVQHLVTQGIREQTTITMMQDFASAGATIVVPANVNIVFTSRPGNVFTYTNSTVGQHFWVDGGNLTLKNVIICGRALSIVGGGIEVRSGGYLILESGSVITNNRNSLGGAVLVWNRGSLIMRDGIIEGNRAMSIGGGVDVSATFTMYGGVIRNNQAGTYGGGVIVTGSRGIFNMYGGIIESNTAPRGGGVHVSTGAIDIRGTSETAVIRNNEAILSGGGVSFSDSRPSAMIGGAIVNNRAGSNGGGVFIAETVQNFPQISDEFVISGNQAPNGDDIWEPGMAQRDGVNVFAYDAIDVDALRAFAERYGFDFEYIYEHLTTGNRQVDVMDYMLDDE